MFNDQQLIWLLRVIKVPNQLKGNPAGVGMKTKQRGEGKKGERGGEGKRGEREKRPLPFY